VLGGDAVETPAFERARAFGAKDFEVVVHPTIVEVRGPRRHGQMARFGRPSGSVAPGPWRPRFRLPENGSSEV
jgi:hypothetical protein